jgi:four helix bundle protein
MPALPAYKKLETWRVGIAFVEGCYRATAEFPRTEWFGLRSQMRRAAVSIPANVAEGYCRRNTKVYAHHVSIALGSHAEVETYLELASRLGFLSDRTRLALEQEAGSVGRLLSALHRSLKETIAQQEAKHS